MQLLNQLRHLILSGQWTPGSRLPSETELQRQLKISRSTIRQALNNIETEGLIERVPGRGTFVAAPPPNNHLSHFIGYVTVDLLSSNETQYKLLSGAESIAKEKGYRILFSNSNQQVDEEGRLLDQLLKDKVGGILIWPALNNDPSRRLFQLIRQGSIPIVLLDRTLPSLNCDCVSSDNYTGGYNAVKHLLDLGHQRIAFLSRPILQLSTIADRLRGYQQALQDASLTPLPPCLVGIVDQELTTPLAISAYSSGVSPEIEQIARYLESSERPTAIFAMNDLMALQALKAASQVGLRVPDDLSLVGFDDMDIVAHLDVPLTTVAQDIFRLGEQATKLLIERIEGDKGPPRQETLPTQLQIRASTTTPATSKVVKQLPSLTLTSG
jgi:DNA-binding LacI/PurR family transcriptional regulator